MRAPRARRGALGAPRAPAGGFGAQPRLSKDEPTASSSGFPGEAFAWQGAVLFMRGYAPLP